MPYIRCCKEKDDENEDREGTGDSQVGGTCAMANIYHISM